MSTTPAPQNRQETRYGGELRTLRPMRDEALVWGVGAGLVLSFLVVVDPVTRLGSPASVPAVSIDLMLGVIVGDTITFAILFSIAAFLIRVVRKLVQATGHRERST